jgi:hypothetical protein
MEVLNIEIKKSKYGVKDNLQIGEKMEIKNKSMQYYIARSDKLLHIFSKLWLPIMSKH